MNFLKPSLDVLLDIDRCHHHVCHNEGTCVAVADEEPRCECRLGFRGPLCEGKYKINVTTTICYDLRLPKDVTGY